MKLLYDIETDGLLPEMTKVHCLVITNLETGEVTSCTDNDPSYFPIEKGLDILASATGIHVGHNIISFDDPALKKLYPAWSHKAELVDTLSIARLIYTNMFELDCSIFRKQMKDTTKLMSSHSLAAWGKRLGLHKGDFGQTTDWSEWTKEMQDYCELDVEVNKKLYDYLMDQKYSERAIKLECDFQKIMFRQQQCGVSFDVEKAKILEMELQEDIDIYTKEIKAKIPPWKTTEVFVPKRDNKRLGYVKGVDFIKKKTVPFNPSSRVQIIKLFKQKYNWEPTEFTKKGNPKIGADVLNNLSFPEAPVLAPFLEANKLMSQLATGKEAWLRHVTDEGKIHGYVNTNGARTGRCTHCIEENQRVTLVGGILKAIKDVKIGDLVYCYDPEMNLKIRKVKERIDKGINKVYEMKWRTNQDGKEGSLLCTLDHKIHTKEGWKRLRDIRVGEKLNHLTVSYKQERPMLCMVGKKTRRQSTFIKEELYGKYGHNWHMHHKDFNKQNDSLDNLIVMTDKEHISLHRSGENSSAYRKESRFSLYKMLLKAGGKPTKINMDFDTFKLKCIETGINLESMLTRFCKNDGSYISKARLLNSMEKSSSPYNIGKTLKIDWHKDRINKLLESHNVISNHWVYEIEEVGERQTYDLHIDEHHNYICEEVSVSNSRPNLAQVPRTGNFKGEECRSLFCAPEGMVMVGADAAGIELRNLGHFLHIYDEGAYVKIILEEDIHSANQRDAALPTRDNAKTFIYAFNYGAGDAKLGSITNPDDPIRVQKMIGAKLRQKFLRANPAITKLLNQVKYIHRTRGYFRGLDGRQLLSVSEHSALNTLLQGAGAVIMKEATVTQWDVLYKQGLYDKVFPALNVHDENQVFTTPDLADDVGKIMVQAIVQAGINFDYRCPLDGEYKIGRSWSETH